jgi:hypothetical protein
LAACILMSIDLVICLHSFLPAGVPIGKMNSIILFAASLFPANIDR